MNRDRRGKSERQAGLPSQYYDDFTVSSADKKAIRDVLAACEYLKEQSAQQ